jgi:P-type E1-E2 ATPase
MIQLAVPGRGELQLQHLILDMNGTLTLEGRLLEGVAERIEQLKETLNVYLLTADTFGTGAQVARQLRIEMSAVSPVNGGQDKADFAAAIAPTGVVAIGNGYNDKEMFVQADLSIAVIGPEGCCTAALQNADIVVNHINDALDLLLNPLRIVADLRS